jgi:myo-inositol-1(or 4)-monophosphatase
VLADGLAVTAEVDGLVEAFEAPDRRWLVAVQWHPERTEEVSPAAVRIFDAFVTEAAGVLRSLDRELAVAVAAARRAGEIQRERYERLERIVHKTAHDVVTEVDELCERRIIETIREAFPSDAVLAEESGESTITGGDTSRLWIVDPLDGTVNYANGIPIFCVSVGLAISGRPAVGVVYDPLRDELFSAVAGRGAWLDGRVISHPAKEQLSDAVVSLVLPPRGWSKRDLAVRKRIRVARVMGSAALALTYVANGRFDAFVQAGGMSLWDVAAAGLIALEGGARVTRRDGGEWFDIGAKSRSIGLVAAAPTHHATLLELIK